MNNKPKGKTTVSQDDYLERTLELIEGKGYARVVDLAGSLGVSQPSASTMIKRLADAGLIEREAYRGFVLSKTGRERAEYIKKRHGVLASFFEAIGIDAVTAARDIDGIEHYLSPKTVEALMRVTRELQSA